MIPQNEFRIGIYVHLKDKGDFLIDHPADLDKILNQNDDDNDYCMPVTITEDWLIKFGFTKASNVNGFYELQILNEWTKIYYQPQFLTCDISISRHNCVPNIKTVHQLQNLYHALTGKELLKPINHE